MLTKKQYSLLILMLPALLLFKQSIGQNYALSLAQNQGDYIHLPLGGTPLAGNPSTYTIECWFYTYNINTGSFRKLLFLEGDDTLIEVGVDDGGQLAYTIQVVDGDIPMTTLGAISENVWTHLAITKQNDQIDFYVDCSLVGSTPLLADLSFNIDNFYLGHQPDGEAEEDWVGFIDDVRLWEKSLTPSEICDQRFCPLACEESGLLAYWDFNNPAVVPGGNNTHLTQVLDCSANANHGTLVDLLQFGSLSNWINSSAPLVYPALHDLTLGIRDYPNRNNLLTEICNGDPAHFCIEENGQTPGPFNNVSVQWQYSDDGGSSWPIVSSPSFIDLCFPVAPGELVLPCATSTDGFINRKYRAAITVTAPAGQSCYYNETEYDLLICCPISPATVEILPAGPFCEGDEADFQVCLNSPDVFVDSPGANLTIEWSFIDPNAGATSIPDAANQVCFDYNGWTAPLPPTGTTANYCFEAVVRNCEGKISTFTSCVSSSPQPVCGTIEGLPLGNPQNLDLISTAPLTYEICPGDDAILGVVTPFRFCTPQWQFTFVDPDIAMETDWKNIGISNTEQNTNILPSDLWPFGAESIYYRVLCNPSSAACEPCVSDWIEIRLKQPPLPPIISGPTQVCFENLPIPLTVTDPQPGVTYTWLYEGLPIGVGNTMEVVRAGCYWLEASNGCQIVEGPPHCLTVCRTVPLLTCPLPPNDCAIPGVPITLSACLSFNTCSGASGLLFEWFVDNVSQGPPGNTCSFTHTPAITGTTYTLVITDTFTGCVGVAEQFVLPCDAN